MVKNYHSFTGGHKPRHNYYEPSPDDRVNHTFTTFYSGDKEGSFQDKFTRQQQYRQKIMSQMEGGPVNGSPACETNKCITPREEMQVMRTSKSVNRFESCFTSQGATRPPQIIRSQRQGSIASNCSEQNYSSKFGRQYQERSKSLNSFGSNDQ